MLDNYGNVIYVGKARILKNRVRQYFHSSEKPEKVMKMVENISDFNYIITDSEMGPKYLQPSFLIFRVTENVGKSSLTSTLI